MSPEPFRELRLRLALWYAGAFAVLLLSFGASTYWLIDRALMRQVDESSRQAAQVLMETLHESDGRLVVGPDFADEAREAAVTRGVVAISVLDERGREIARGPSSGAGALLWYDHPIQVGGRRLGTLRVAHDLRETRTVLSRFRTGLAIAIPGALIGTCLVGYVLAGVAIRPMRRSFEQQRRFMADASHELRTPLAVLLTQADVALDEPEPSMAGLRAALESVSRAGRRMARLVDELLLLSRLNAATEPRDALPFDLAELVDEVLDDLELPAKTADVHLQALGLETARPVEGVPDEVRMALVNVVHNALKHAGPGGTVQVRLEAREPNLTVIAVQDSGPGIDPADLPHMFERFYRGDRARSRGIPGTGLGLAIARALVEANGGMLEARNVPDGGALFELLLPTTARGVAALAGRVIPMSR